MDVICNNAYTCNSIHCLHRIAHKKSVVWCTKGSCRWSPETHCVPYTIYDRIEEKLCEYGLTRDDAQKAAAEIEKIINNEEKTCNQKP